MGYLSQVTDTVKSTPRKNTPKGKIHPLHPCHYAGHDGLKQLNTNGLYLFLSLFSFLVL